MPTPNQDAPDAELEAPADPIETHLAALAAPRELPALALRACTARIDEAGPPLRALLERAAAGAALDEAEANLLFCGLHILAAARDSAACAPLLRFVRRPEEEVDRVLGDAITATLPKVAASLFDGDADALFAAVADGAADEYVRNALLEAATFLAWEGRIDRAAMRGFLERFFHERLAEDLDHA